MQTLADRIRIELSKKRLSQQWLAEQVGVSQQAIAKVVNGDTKSPKNIVEIATALGVDVNWLKTGEGDSEIGRITAYCHSEKDNEHTLRVDLLDVNLAAYSSGIINAEYPNIVSSLYFTEEGANRILGRTTTNGVYMFRVPTDSMVPTIKQTDIVFIDTNIKHYIGEGIYAFSLNGEEYIKRLQRLPTGVIRALSDNKHYEPFDITEELFDSAVIIGKFIKAVEWNVKNL
ncbi:TPA: XRE family transcriptional regulator [Haemophilus influenzae]|uniref:Helix-turn-helix transcriptional regulator n=1 Tax=Haemophilus haemolyticus TaxID=726 RepID=A0A852Q1N2_HAEHA|nr:S24 family peptidase [Haemophilus haemolyticus]NYA28097.1 helix-turn-helix transcriptional regulator [Haemophilus haemolyticus]